MDLQHNVKIEDLYQVLNLLYNRFDSFQVIWGIYTTVALGLIAALISFPKHISSVLARVVIIIGFLFFVNANYNALDLINIERHYLYQEAHSITDELCRKSNDNRKIYQMVYAKEILPNSDLLWFHLIMDTLVLIMIWFVPKILIALKPFKSISKQEIKINGSKLPNPKISWNQLSKIWILEEEVNVNINSKKIKKIVGIKIPSDFQFDLSTIPRFLWSIVAPFELSIIAPLVHDFIYVNKGNLTINENNIIIKSTTNNNFKLSRLEADSIFLNHMKLEGIGFIKRYFAYLGVRLFGGIFWSDN
jgi:hypothetical protein